METKLTKLQSYNAMIKLLDIYYEQTQSDDLGSLLSAMHFLIDGSTADSALWEDWLDSIQAVTTKEENLTKLQAYKAMIKFLEIYYSFTKSEDTKSLLNKMELIPTENSADPVLWANWVECIDATLEEPENHKPLLTFTSTDKKI